MANENKYQSLSQIDYCMRQYFSRYMAPALTNEVRSLRQKQSREFRDSWNQNASPFVPVNMQIRNADMYNPQNEMFSHFGTKRYNFKNETQLFKVIPHTSKNQKKSTGFAGTKYI